MEERVRGSGSRVVLAIQDTMHVESGDQDNWVHSTLVVTPERVAQGLLQQQVWELRSSHKSQEAAILGSIDGYLVCQDGGDEED